MQCLTIEKMRSVKLLWAGKKCVAPKHQEVLCRITHPAGTPASWWGWGAALLGSHVALLRHNKVTAVSVADLSGSLQLYQICAVSWSRTSWPNLWHWSMLDIKLHFLKVNLKYKYPRAGSGKHKKQTSFGNDQMLLQRMGRLSPFSCMY